MPKLFDAHARHSNCYLVLAEKAAELFVRESTQTKGITIFDDNRGQIEAALEWVEQQEETHERDLVLAAFVDALSGPGMLRYSIRDRLIPLLEQRISIAQRLGAKDMEADAYDDLGIKYAYLGYHQEAIKLFQKAAGGASEASYKDLRHDIQKHLELARKQLQGRSQKPANVLTLVRLVFFQVKRGIAQVSKNPFMEITALNRVASIYLEWGWPDVAARLFQRAMNLSKENAYQLGELDAAMGLLYSEILMGSQNFTPLPLAENVQFEWSNDLLVMQTLLELGPVIQKVETIAHHMKQSGDSRASQIYQGLDNIMAEMDKLLSAIQQKTENKQEILVSCMTAIRDILANTIILSSKENEDGPNQD
jgi:tetratricopeptide (TPR) repeat protein